MLPSQRGEPRRRELGSAVPPFCAPVVFTLRRSPERGRGAGCLGPGRAPIGRAKLRDPGTNQSKTRTEAVGVGSPSGPSFGGQRSFRRG
ncbi:mCG147054 [Mus musculus]|nr:mCG147054 [Mus musculus]